MADGTSPGEQDRMIFDPELGYSYSPDRLLLMAHATDIMRAAYALYVTRWGVAEADRFLHDWAEGVKDGPATAPLQAMFADPPRSFDRAG
jgi:hypothetical protein